MCLKSRRKKQEPAHNSIHQHSGGSRRQPYAAMAMAQESGKRQRKSNRQQYPPQHAACHSGGSLCSLHTVSPVPFIPQKNTPQTQKTQRKNQQQTARRRSQPETAEATRENTNNTHPSTQRVAAAVATAHCAPSQMCRASIDTEGPIPTPARTKKVAVATPWHPPSWLRPQDRQDRQKQQPQQHARNR